MTDKEDLMECPCYIIFCFSKLGLFLDRVYRNKELAQKRIEYLNKVSGERAEWMIRYSELGN